MRRLQRWFIGWLCLGLAACLPAAAQTKLDNAQLDQLMAPVALYPDSLLSQILMGATYPEDVAAAAKWSAAHTSESGDQAVKAVEGEAWDPSVKSLVAFPSVMDMMGRQPDWVKSVGDAFLAQPDAVMDSVQRLRVQAQKAGNLKSTPQQKVTSNTTNDKTVVVIEPADPQVVYVPSYNPTVVYGAWAYPSYPPYYYPPPPGSVFATSLVAGIGFGLGVAAVNSMWGGFDWGHGDVDIDVNRYNNINVNQRIDRNNVNNNKVGWQHNPANRGNTPYADQGSRQRFDSQRQAGVQNRAQQRQGQAGRAPGAAPSSRDAARNRAAQSFEGRTGQAIPGHGQQGAGRGQGAAGRGEAAGGRGQGGAGRGEAAGGRGQGQGPQAGQGARERPQGGAGAAQHDRAGMSTQDRQAAAQRQRADESAARDRGRASNSTNALSDAGNGERMRQQSHRGEMSRGGGGGVQRGGGGHGGGRGGGGGGHFGGRR
ncbi:DUF3300 domain-containing protein [Achromobacter denitrificans]|uniref:DUF3300 domain-containing protein n=3 Tax=Achromobacter denitrificans TaxID=32002 RepID=A0ABZ3G3Y7_ACHDE|nr:DUF3300 domain-containing protein [Achromobacter denitrificans]MBV2157280.1 DUF3300 domain-containing protein [Achromobacter denitrificans]MDF3857313.1 DUF3300 domain-containing protein [Achromobacter denitrificans]QCS62807.1 DUF3300 domain-containing protein [Achromobacter denitrificans]RSE84732.1 DUF3300 domain-containing protein [Achromobacter denitrificans]WFC67970.1 DUF3300 domain-containing protein [Achromobacter denitrificans]